MDEPFSDVIVCGTFVVLRLKTGKAYGNCGAVGSIA
jgi:hypothetical protein